MNTLSWLLYVADVVDSAGWRFGEVTFFAGMLCLMSLFGCILINNFYPRRDNIDDDGSRYSSENVAAQKNYKIVSKLCKTSTIVFVVFWLLGIVTPERETVLSIAASEAAEEVVTTPEATILRQLIRKKLEEALNPVETGK